MKRNFKPIINQSLHGLKTKMFTFVQTAPKTSIYSTENITADSAVQSCAINVLNLYLSLSQVKENKINNDLFLTFVHKYLSNRTNNRPGFVYSFKLEQQSNRIQVKALGQHNKRKLVFFQDIVLK
jgi:hypothetical protein